MALIDGKMITSTVGGWLKTGRKFYYILAAVDLLYAGAFTNKLQFEHSVCTIYATFTQGNDRCEDRIMLFSKFKYYQNGAEREKKLANAYKDTHVSHKERYFKSKT